MRDARMDIAEFRERGYLQEVNRRFLHPLGLALEVCVEVDGTESLGGVWDYREDAEGIYFGEADAAKAEAVDREWRERQPGRVQALGYMIEPPGDGGLRVSLLAAAGRILCVLANRDPAEEGFADAPVIGPVEWLDAWRSHRRAVR